MFDYFFAQYRDYPIHEVYLELIAVFFGLCSVWHAKKDNIWVFPTGLISTSIYAYLLWQWSLLGDSMINVYYFIMSIYGWYHWTRKKDNIDEFPISTMNGKNRIMAVIIFVFTIIFVVVIYIYFNKFTNWYSYLDTLLTAIFFVGMWLMAKRKIENWIFWIVGDLLSIPLYFAKGYTFTSFQYIVFTIIAVYGFLEWKKILNSSQRTEHHQS
jgi:nicotinamide mononucleotide transporter